MAKLSKFTRNIMNLAQGIREVRELHETILQNSTCDPTLPFLQHATNTGRSSEWAIAVSQLVGHMDAAAERCNGDLMIGCIIYSLGMDFWDLDIVDLPRDWETTDLFHEQWLRDEDLEHYNETRGYYSDSNFDRNHTSHLNMIINRAELGDWAHNQEVIRQWYHSVILRGEDLMQATTLARLSVR